MSEANEREAQWAMLYCCTYDARALGLSSGGGNGFCDGLSYPIKSNPIKLKQFTTVDGMGLWLFVLSVVPIWTCGGRTMGFVYALESLRQ